MTPFASSKQRKAAYAKRRQPTARNPASGTPRRNLARLEIDGPDGKSTLTIAEFLQANPHLTAEEKQAIRRLQRGELAYHFGGGSQPAFRVRRI